MTEEKKKKKTGSYGFGCLITIIVVIGLLATVATVVIVVYNGYSKVDVNSKELKNYAPKFFVEVAKITYPENSEIKHISFWGAGRDGGHDLIIIVKNIKLVVSDLDVISKLESSEMEYPVIKESTEYRRAYVDLCSNINFLPKTSKRAKIHIEDEKLKESFCGPKKILLKSNKKDDVSGAELIVVIPDENLIWIHKSYVF